MRRVPVSEVREGAFLARPLYSDTGDFMLAEGILLTQDLLDRITRVGYHYIYILDEFSQEEYQEVLKPRMLSEMNHLYSEGVQYLKLSDGKKLSTTQMRQVDKSMEQMSAIVEGVLQDIVKNDDIVKSLIPISQNDDFTFKHSINVTMLALTLGNACALNFHDLKQLAQGTLFHDMGKVFVSKSILNKPGKLTDSEMEIVRGHCKKGFDFLNKNTVLPLASTIIALDHHERWDGTGYPDGKSGKQIHKFGRITTICDVFEAMSAERPYKQPVPVSECREYISAGGGSFFEFELVCKFVKLINPYPRDSIVRLSSGQEGVVVEVNQDVLTRPKVKIYCEDGQRIEPYIVDLYQNRTLTIIDILPVFSFDKK